VARARHTVAVIAFAFFQGCSRACERTCGSVTRLAGDSDARSEGGGQKKQGFFARFEIFKGSYRVCGPVWIVTHLSLFSTLVYESDLLYSGAGEKSKVLWRVHINPARFSPVKHTYLSLDTPREHD
jgi:hypothetical protein